MGYMSYISPTIKKINMKTTMAEQNHEFVSTKNYKINGYGAESAIFTHNYKDNKYDVNRNSDARKKILDTMVLIKSERPIQLKLTKVKLTKAEKALQLRDIVQKMNNIAEHLIISGGYSSTELMGLANTAARLKLGELAPKDNVYELAIELITTARLKAEQFLDVADL